MRRIKIKTGYSRTVYKYLATENFEFFQVPHSPTVSIRKKGASALDILNVHFDPLKPENGFQGGPTATSSMSRQDWLQICESALAELEASLDDIANFSDVRFQPVYGRADTFKIVPRAEAILRE